MNESIKPDSCGSLNYAENNCPLRLWWFVRSCLSVAHRGRPSHVGHGQWNVNRKRMKLGPSVLKGEGNAPLHSFLLSAGSVVNMWAAVGTAILEHELEVTC